ncbi:hypothetical protein [Azospirillum lipoferum]|nr:hypothetical protein [Azospirillum lipoferum]
MDNLLLADDELGQVSEDVVGGLIDLIQLLERKYTDLGSWQGETSAIVIEYLSGYVSHHSGVFRTEIPDEYGARQCSWFVESLKNEVKGKLAREQIGMALARKGRGDNVNLPPTYKEQIRDLVSRIKLIIDDAAIPPDRHDDIMAKLNAFAAEIEKNQTNLEKLGKLWLSLTRHAGEGAKNLEPAVRLIERVRKMIGGVQDEQEAAEAAAITQDIRKRLPPPSA